MAGLTKKVDPALKIQSGVLLMINTNAFFKKKKGAMEQNILVWKWKWKEIVWLTVIIVGTYSFIFEYGIYAL